MSDHVLLDVDRDVLASVVHRDRVPDHGGDDRGRARPGLDHALLPGRVHPFDLLEQMLGDTQCFLDDAVGGFLDDAVAGNVNRAVDGGRCPKGCLDLGVAERPHIAVRAAVDGGISPQSEPAGEELRACPGAGREGHRRGRGRWRRPSDGITADANAIIPDGNVARAGVAETVEAYSGSGFAAGPFDAVRAG